MDTRTAFHTAPLTSTSIAANLSALLQVVGAVRGCRHTLSPNVQLRSYVYVSKEAFGQLKSDTDYSPTVLSDGILCLSCCGQMHMFSKHHELLSHCHGNADTAC